MSTRHHSCECQSQCAQGVRGARRAQGVRGLWRKNGQRSRESQTPHTVHRFRRTELPIYGTLYGSVYYNLRASGKADRGSEAHGHARSENADRKSTRKQRCRVAEIVDYERLITQARAIWTGRFLFNCHFSSLGAAQEELRTRAEFCKVRGRSSRRWVASRRSGARRRARRWSDDRGHGHVALTLRRLDATGAACVAVGRAREQLLPRDRVRHRNATATAAAASAAAASPDAGAATSHSCGDVAGRAEYVMLWRRGMHLHRGCRGSAIDGSRGSAGASGFGERGRLLRRLVVRVQH